jgi:UDP-N-acetylmuramoylalanine--D-glutamate ligase
VTALVYGFAVAGASTARALRARDVEVIAVDDDVTDARRELAADLGVELLPTPSASDLERLVGSCDLVCPAPGVPETHAVIDAAQRCGVELVSEIELAYRWEQDRDGGPRPILAVTGTDGKTTTTLLTVEMLRAGGVRTIDAGNTDTPLVDAIDLDVDAFVVECTSFRLAWTPTFRAEAAAWLNLAPDHLNWHASMTSYETAKARIFANQRADDTSIGLATDPVVVRHLDASPARHITFGLDRGDYRRSTADGRAVLTGPGGTLADVDTMRRALPHDITNALAASALVLESGLVDAAAVGTALATFVGPKHRLEHLADIDGVGWYNDSKATTPHAASAAIRSFRGIVLIAGGYDKGVDLSPMAAEPDRVDALIAIGRTGPALAAVFGGVDRVDVVDTLDEAVELAARIASPGQTVLLSPGCASFDQYSGFEARGDHFRSLVDALQRQPRRAVASQPDPGDRT